MSKGKNPAFPAVDIVSGDNYNSPTQVYYTGMTLRDYFAAKAMQGFAADPNLEESFTETEIAKMAYRWANAMMIERTHQS